MSDCKWCDKGGHAFSVLEPGWQRMTMQEAFEDAQGNMQSRNRVMDVCADHSVVPTTPAKAAIVASDEKPETVPQRLPNSYYGRKD